ncbi:hypothetical protein VP1G_10792 [Cytospora mali]|uniref:Uncharacterized protein n=1 Tax=Cytospora mali TaxID=578113 RepID=A0A194UWE9_CYTMA|nr:hypothetical protein VP1G_10792 [Valsa mali var. pyri (nom. inval.)]
MPIGRIDRLLPCIRAVPLAGHDIVHRVRCHLQHVTRARHLALLDLPDLLPNANEGIHEPVQLLLGLALGRLDHERVGDGPAHGRRVEAVVLQPLGDVDGLDACAGAEGPRVQDELVRAPPVLVRVQDLIVRLKLAEEVVGVQEGDLCGLLQTRRTHQHVVRPADRQDRRAAVGGAADEALSLQVDVDVGRCEVWHEVLLDTDGSDAGTTAAVGNAEGLVQVEMAHVCADLAGRAQPDLGVHVRAVHVDLSAMTVDDLAHPLDSRLKYAKGGGTGKFTLRSRVGLQRDAVHGRDALELVLKGGDHLEIALDSVPRGEGVDIGKAGLGNEGHLGRAVELHCARAERNHGVDKREVLGLQVVNVSQHLSLRMVGVEDWLEDVGVGAEKCFNAPLRGSFFLVQEAGNHGTQVVQRCRLIDADSDLFAIKATEMNSTLFCPGNQVGCGGRTLLTRLTNDHSVENGTFCDHFPARLRSNVPNHLSSPHDPFGDVLQALRSVIDGVQGGHVGKQGLSGANVARGLFSPDVLLTSLQCQSEGSATKSVLGYSDQSTWHLPLVLLGNGEESGMRTAEAHRHTQSLRGSKGKVSAPLARRCQNSQCQQLPKILDLARSVGVLDHNTDKIITELLQSTGEFGGQDISLLDLDTETFSTA